jgi:DNA modification methylase
MRKISDKLGFDIVRAKTYRPKKKTKSSEKSLIFSKKIIAMLEEKMNYHNKNNTKQVKLIDLKRAYKLGFNNAEDLNKETLAHVSMYLNVLKNNTLNIFNNFKSQGFEILGNEIIVKGNLSPQDSDYKQAEEDVVKYKLENFDFKSHEELYLEDEEDRVTTFDIE